MLQGSLTRWGDLATSGKIAFAGIAFSSGSLYHEIDGQLGIRRWSPLAMIQELAGFPPNRWLEIFKRFGVSLIARYGRLYSGATFQEVAPQSYILQGSVSYGWHTGAQHPLLELELGATLDSGLFVDLKGDALEERFWTLALRAYPFTIETWNDQLNRKDFGPTYGVRLMMEVYWVFPSGRKQLST